MEEILNETAAYHSIWEFKGQEEFIDNWLLMSSPFPVLAITAAYLFFVLKLGPRYMAKRPAMDLSKVLIMYNIAQVLASIYVFFIGMDLLSRLGLFSSKCKMCESDTRKLATGIYCYFIAKISEFLDTIFFVLRKKNNQISFLHVYHHTTMAMASWVMLKYEPTHTTTFLGTLNSLVHIVMYSYYLLSTIPSISKYLWWKKYITTFQLVQFAMVILHAFSNHYVSGCPPSYMLLSTILFNASLFIYLFSDFYVKAYLKNRREEKARVEAKASLIKEEKHLNNGEKFASRIKNGYEKLPEKVK